MNSNKSPEAESSHSPGPTVSPNLDYTNEPPITNTQNTNVHKHKSALIRKGYPKIPKQRQLKGQVPLNLKKEHFCFQLCRWFHYYMFRFSASIF